MTTPAVSVNEQSQMHMQEWWIYDNYPTEHSDYGMVHGSHVVRARPASVSNPANPINGWRSPAGFYNAGWRMVMPAGDIKYQYSKNDPQYRANVIAENFPWNEVYDNYPPAVSSETYSRAINQALGKIKAQKVNLGQMVLEAGETSELIVSTINKISNLTKAFKSKSPKAFLWAKTVGSVPGHRGSKIPDAYLEYVYGYKPLIQDAYGAVDELNTRGQSKPPAMTVIGRSGSKDSGTKLINSQYDGRCTMDVNWKTSENCFVRMDLELVNPFTATLSSLGILNPIALAWERLPYSFVADWFVPIGTYLGNLDAGLGYQFKAGSVSTISRRSEVSTHFNPRPDSYPYTDYRWSGTKYEYEGWNFRRTPLYEVPFGSVYFKNPFPKNGVHIANAIALLVGALR